MKVSIPRVAVLLFTFAVSTQVQSPQAFSKDAPPLLLEQTIMLPGVKGGFDLMAADLAGRRLFVAGQDNNTLEVIDLATGKPIRSVPGFHQPKGVVHLPEFGKLYVSNKDDGTCRVLDARSLEPIKSIAFGSKANNLRYDAQTRMIYVGYGDGAIGTIDPRDDSRGVDMPLASYPKQFRLEERGTRIFVNVPVANHIAVIDRVSHKVLDTWAVKEEKGNVPMALDDAHQRLFIGCEPGRFVVFDTHSGKSIASLKITEDADGISYDAKRKFIYVSCGGGTIDVVQQVDTDHYKVVGSVPTERGAGTSLFVPEFDRLYLAVPQTPDRPGQIRIYRPL